MSEMTTHGRRLPVRVTVNGIEQQALVEPRRLLVDLLREDLGLTGTHVGCEHGVCGACTVLLDGRTVRSCLMFAIQANDRSVMTVEALAAPDGALHPIQEAFWEQHGLQCGFCTPGFLMTAYELLQASPVPTDEQIRSAISGNLCRCTGYQNIVRSVRAAADKINATASVNNPVAS
jgi:aerobic-type carbon monoxide dehydrogenase small subunit (CoxS/CutS family)